MTKIDTQLFIASLCTAILSVIFRVYSIDAQRRKSKCYHIFTRDST